MATPTLEKSPYLQTIGNGLHPDIDIFWTGKNIHIINIFHTNWRSVSRDGSHRRLGIKIDTRL